MGEGERATQERRGCWRWRLSTERGRPPLMASPVLLPGAALRARPRTSPNRVRAPLPHRRSPAARPRPGVPLGLIRRQRTGRSNHHGSILSLPLLNALSRGLGRPAASHLAFSCHTLTSTLRSDAVRAASLLQPTLVLRAHMKQCIRTPCLESSLRPP